jgi:DivIVA domain-containing protein
VPDAESGDPTVRQPAPSEIADVSFPASVRGYDRGAVDTYLNRVQLLVTELESTRSPEAAVKQALEQVGEQTKRVLAQAGETAEQITAAARQKAEDSTTRAEQEAARVAAAAKAEAAEVLVRSKANAEATVAKARKKAAEHLQSARAEAAALREEAEARLRELRGDMETVRGERSHLLDDLRELAKGVKEVAGAADARFPPPKVAERAEEESLEPEGASEGAGTEEPATDAPTLKVGKRERSSA